MASKKHKTSKAKKNVKEIEQPVVELPTFAKSYPLLSSRKNLLIYGSVIILALLIFYKKDLFVAALVNGSPVTTPELLGRLRQDYGNQVLDELINEKIILAEAKKQRVQVTKQDVQGRIAELEAQIGGAEALETFLAQQGQSKRVLEDRIRVRLAMEKLYSNEATVSVEEIDTFLKENKDQLTATDAASQKAEAEQAIREQKLSQILFTKFDELKQNAKISIF